MHDNLQILTCDNDFFVLDYFTRGELCWSSKRGGWENLQIDHSRNQSKGFRARKAWWVIVLKDTKIARMMIVLLLTC